MIILSQHQNMQPGRRFRYLVQPRLVILQAVRFWGVLSDPYLLRAG